MLRRKSTTIPVARIVRHTIPIVLCQDVHATSGAQHTCTCEVHACYHKAAHSDINGAAGMPMRGDEAGGAVTTRRCGERRAVSDAGKTRGDVPVRHGSVTRDGHEWHGQVVSDVDEPTHETTKSGEADAANGATRECTHTASVAVDRDDTAATNGAIPRARRTPMTRGLGSPQLIRKVNKQTRDQHRKYEQSVRNLRAYIRKAERTMRSDQDINRRSRKQVRAEKEREELTRKAINRVKKDSETKRTNSNVEAGGGVKRKRQLDTCQ